MQDWEKGSGYVKEPKVTVGPGISKDGSATGGVEIEAANPQDICRAPADRKSVV